jgi:beta-lactamase superfamily II metal-dependent hydrolase
MRTAMKRLKGHKQSKPRPPASTGATTVAGSGLRVRMYRVGFGDFFLVTVPTSQGARHILIDCGVHAGDIGSISDAVANMAEETDRHLALVIVTHRHADHISGFATCAEQFRQFTVDTVWMSWWDNPANQKANRFQANLRTVAVTTQAHLALRADTDPEARQALDMVRNITGDALGIEQGAAAGRLAKNDAALAMLRGVPQGSEYRFRSDPVRHYLKAGDQPELPPDLVQAGLVAQVLGPPIDENLVAQMNNAVEQYLAIVGDGPDARRVRPFGDERRVRGSAYPTRSLYPYSPGQLEHLVQSVLPDSPLAIARKADNTINNQSLVVHFTVTGKSLLFVGDAQWGDWANFLFGGAVTGRGAPQVRPESARLLADVDFYKVGHHGSTNATPIDAVKALRDGCAAMCSTQPGCYGQESKGSEVPRGPLLEALQKKTKNRLVRSDQIPAGTAQRTAGLTESLPANFSSPGKLFIDCQL